MSFLFTLDVYRLLNFSIQNKKNKTKKKHVPVALGDKGGRMHQVFGVVYSPFGVEQWYQDLFPGLLAITIINVASFQRIVKSLSGQMRLSSSTFFASSMILQ